MIFGTEMSRTVPPAFGGEQACNGDVAGLDPVQNSAAVDAVLPEQPKLTRLKKAGETRMQSMRILLMGLATGAVLVLPPVTRAATTIVGTAHDLSGNGWGTDQICVYCHTPHNAKSPQLVPLWNHAATAESFTLYSSSTLNATPGQPAGVSKACLSCHDGVTAIDSYGTRTGTHLMTGTAKLGTDLTDDHPISFTYDAALATADGGLVTPSSSSWVDGAHTVPLYTAKLECGSCHNVHNNSTDPFLRKSNAASALCLTCHNK
jgi:predicted CXXCH cytochrome family protein